MKTRARKHLPTVREYAIAAGLGALVLLLAWAVWGIAQKEEIARGAVDARKAELASLENRRAMLAASLAELESARGQEATLRQNHGVAKAGEEVIILVPKEEGRKSAEKPWYRRFLDALPF